MKEEEEKHVGTFRPGYRLTQVEMAEMKKRMRRRKADKTDNPAIEIPNIWDSFPKAYHVQQPEVTKKEISSITAKDRELNNWFAVPYKNVKFFE